MCVASEFSDRIKQWQLTDVTCRGPPYTQGALSHTVTLQYGEHDHELIFTDAKTRLRCCYCQGGSGGEESQLSVCSLSLSSGTANFLAVLKGFGLPQEVNVGGES